MPDTALRHAWIATAGEVVAAPGANHYISIYGVVFANPTASAAANYLRSDGAAGTIVVPGPTPAYGDVPIGDDSVEVARCAENENLYLSGTAGIGVKVSYRIKPTDPTY